MFGQEERGEGSSIDRKEMGVKSDEGAQAGCGGLTKDHGIPFLSGGQKLLAQKAVGHRGRDSHLGRGEQQRRKRVLWNDLDSGFGFKVAGGSGVMKFGQTCRWDPGRRALSGPENE